ncbi:MAG: hypothetical protein JST91_29870 [Actinobacteria bacterium]|nr:hypothetical protein [Actinomycetota bacterium]
MASDIETLADALRALASHAAHAGREVAQAAQASARLVEAAHAQGRSGLQVGPLVAQLQTAAKSAEAAAAGVAQVAVHGESFADHLAHTRSAHPVGGIRADLIATLMGTFVNGWNADLPTTPATDVTGDIGTHQVQQAAAVDRADSDNDRWDAANQLATRRNDNAGGRATK